MLWKGSCCVVVYSEHIWMHSYSQFVLTSFHLVIYAFCFFMNIVSLIVWKIYCFKSQKVWLLLIWLLITCTCLHIIKHVFSLFQEVLLWNVRNISVSACLRFFLVIFFTNGAVTLECVQCLYLVTHTLCPVQSFNKSLLMITWPITWSMQHHHIGQRENQHFPILNVSN